MRVTVVGSGDAFGSGGRFQTCIALGPDDTQAASHTLIDCGATSAVALKQQGFDLNRIETVLVTHLHGDHFGGIVFLILDGQFRRRSIDLTVIGPPGTQQRLEEAMEASFPGSTQVTRRFAVRVLEHQERTLRVTGRFTAVPFEVRHASGAPSYAIRVEDADNGACIAYSGDTEWTDALLDAAQGTDLFLCEGYAPGPVRWHMDLATLEGQRGRLETRRLILTHLSPTALEADLSGWDIAHDGLAITI
ncbi:MBL fold metallo-hydrolase [Streptomyces bathyalis]|uniref:MBL fold metallo-hydrolase n=1 Tax=Streptomyces bathyalis TaxID=2710756 RepID=A0A7T1TC52_9ACTN|nr:MBL fold metallo-hydrolase [Streptomyces bathyalis]QPP10281.1 MBL fold metallo-hydrolase [Streptomyces bathyalis]